MIRVTRSLANELDASSYRMVVPWRAGAYTDSMTSSTRVITPNSVNLPLSGGGTAGSAGFYFDPADYASASKTLKLRLRGVVHTNATAPGINFTFGLYPIASVAGAADTNTATLGTVTSGSTAAFTAPSLSTATTAASTDFTAPAAGHYALGVVLSGAVTADASGQLIACLELRNV